VSYIFSVRLLQSIDGVTLDMEAQLEAIGKCFVEVALDDIYQGWSVGQDGGCV